MSKNLANYNYCNQAIQHKDDIENRFWILADMLYRIRTGELYKDGWTSWDEYCHEFKGLSRRSMDKMVQLYTVFVHQYQIPIPRLQEARGWAVLAETLPYVKSKEDAEEWIEKSKVMTLQDIRKELKEQKTGQPMAHCAHPNKIQVWFCPDCEDSWRTFEEENQSNP